MVPILGDTLLPKDKQVELRLLLSVDSSQYLVDGTLIYVWEQHPNSMWMQWVALLKLDKLHEIKNLTDELPSLKGPKTTKISKQYQEL